MQRSAHSPLLRARGGGRTNQRSMGSERRGYIWLALGLVAIIVLGLLLFGQAKARLGSDGRMGDDAFLVKGDFKSGRLSEEQLQKLVGMYYAKDPASEDLKGLSEQGENIIVREQLPEKTRVIPPGGMVTMDFVEDRLNVHLDNTSRIKKAKYG